MSRRVFVCVCLCKCAALNKPRRAMRCSEAKRQTKALRVVRNKVSSSSSSSSPSLLLLFDILLRRRHQLPTTSTRDRKDNQILCESKRFPIFVFFFIFFILAKHSKRFAVSFGPSFSVSLFLFSCLFLHHHEFTVYAFAYVCKAHRQDIFSRIYLFGCCVSIVTA